MNFFEPSEEDDKLGSTVQPLVFSIFFYLNKIGSIFLETLLCAVFCR